MASEITSPGGAAPAGAMQQERKKLRKVLTRFDLICFTIAAFISIDTIAATAAYGGGQTIIWILFAMVMYLLPSGLIVAELGSTFPVEGGPYAWPRMAFGRLPGAITATFYWMSNPTWMGGTLAGTVVATLASGLMFNTSSGGFSTVWSILIGLAVVWAITFVSIIEVRWGRWTGIIGTFVRIALVALFLVLVAWFIIDKGKPAGTIGWGDLKPSITGFLAVIGLLQFLFVGFELSNGAAEEMKHPQRDVPAMIIRSGLSVVAIVLLMIVPILLVIPLQDVSNVAGFADAYNAVKGVLGGGAGAVGWLAGILIIITIITAGGVWLQGSARVQAVAGLDGCAPRVLGKFSKSGTPIAMNLISATIGSVFVILVFTVSSGSLANFFAVMLALVVSLTAMQYAFIMPSVIVLRKKYPDRNRPYKVPGGMAGVWVCVIATEIMIVLTTVTLLWPGLLEKILGKPFSIVDYWGTSRVFFETVTLGSLAVIILMAVIFWAIGRRDIARGIVGENDLLTAVAPAPDEA
jgi:amino acid transporter